LSLFGKIAPGFIQRSLDLGLSYEEYMNYRTSDSSCAECGIVVGPLPTQTNFKEQEIHLFHPVLCKPCLLDLCKQYSVVCVNCGETIPPYSQVGVLKGNRGENQFVHMTASCQTTGSAFHGYWGKGKLHSFVEIEAC
tara:strand:+ start:223 stop:633 length:411 start_codon:yes stop_codon:yes gene_type:complete